MDAPPPIESPELQGASLRPLLGLLACVAATLLLIALAGQLLAV